VLLAGETAPQDFRLSLICFLVFVFSLPFD